MSKTVSQAKGMIRRKFRIEAQKGSAFRSVSLDILLEYPGQGGGLSGWNVFTGRLDFPETIYCAGARKVYYADVCYGTVLPLLSLYHAEKNCGLTVACDPAVFPSGRLACGNTCSVLARGTGDRRWKKATFKVQESGRIAVTLDGHSNAYVVKITTVR